VECDLCNFKTNATFFQKDIYKHICKKCRIKMSNFDKAWKVLYGHEKGITTDHAGYTKDGITLRSLDIDIDLDGDIDFDDIRKMTLDDEKAFYKRRWWDQYNYDKINNDMVATKLFDLAVNMGQQQASLLIQRALRACDRLGIAEDGKLGSKSFKAINITESERLIPALRSEAAGFYRLIVFKNPDYETFLNGWLNRAYS